MLALVVFLLTAVMPVFFGRLRVVPYWLAVQALALAWALASSHVQTPAHSLAVVLEVVLVRGLLAPWLMHGVLTRRGEGALELMPSNLFAWAVAVALIVMAFEFGGAAVAETGTFTLGVVGACVAIAFLVLSTNEAGSAQWSALLLLENALALFESLLPDPWALPVHVALSLVYLLTLAAARYLLAPVRAAEPPADPITDGAGAPAASSAEVP